MDRQRVAAIFDQIHRVVIRVTVGHQDQIGRQIVALARIGIHIDDLSLSGNDMQAAMPLL